MDAFYYSTSLADLPRFRQDDVARIVEELSRTKRAKLDKGYKFFFEQFIFDYEVSNVVDKEIRVRARCYRSLKKSEEPHKLEVKAHGYSTAVR